jgi:hypothetical protein
MLLMRRRNHIALWSGRHEQVHVSIQIRLDKSFNRDIDESDQFHPCFQLMIELGISFAFPMCIAPSLRVV